MADRIGISFASIRRYEKATRNPDIEWHHPLYLGYKTILEDMLEQIEADLLVKSYITAHELEDGHPITQEDAVWWAVGDTGIEDVDITHITYLTDIRSLLPEPSWREPSPHNFYLNGYNKKHLVDTVGQSRSHKPHVLLKS